MATSLRNGVPLSFVARTLSDATDATNAGRGAMRALANLVPDPTTRGNWVCRPGQVDTIEFSSLNAATFVTAMLPIGNIVYGMVSSGLFAGKDQPFAYDLDAGAFLTVAGIEDANLPVSPPATGHWTPPIMAQVGSRILVTHTGFPGSTTGEPSDYGIKFGWFDISDFNGIIEIDYEDGQPFLFGGPDITFGVQPGMAVTGAADIPAGTVVKNIYPVTQSARYITGDSHSTDIIDGIGGADMVEMFPGKAIAGPGIQPGTTILAVPTGASIQLTQPATTTAAAATFLVWGNIPNYYPYLNRGDFTAGSATVTVPTPLQIHRGALLTGSAILPNTYVSSISGTTMVMSQPATTTVAAASPGASFSSIGSVIEMSASATATGTGPLAIVGGSRSAPLWGAGDTAINHLPEIPVGVAQMNGRAWFASPDGGIPWSDSLLPCVRTNATQALMADDRRPITAIAPLMLTAPIVGGIVQALIAFQGVSAMHQISGDPTTNNLTFNILPVTTGTLAPNTITPSTLGTFFVSPEGLRLIDFKAGVSDPIGQDGEGVISPFLSVVAPPIPFSTLAQASRMAAAAGGRTLRIDAPDADGTVFSYWFDLTRKIWTGPHTGGASLVEVWNDTFLVSSSTRLVVQRADDIPRVYSVYEENGQQLLYEWETSLLPDSGEMSENTIIESAIMVALQPDELTQIDFLDEIRGPLDGVTLRGLDVPEALWGTAIFGVTLTGPDPGTIRQRQIPWTLPLVFKQGRVNIRGLSSATVTLGNFYMRYQVLGYLLQVPQIPVAPSDEEFFLLANDGVTILSSNGNVNLRPH